MTWWNYRITVDHSDEEPVYAVREVYYDDDDRITMWTADPVYPRGETRDELAQALEWYASAAERDVIDVTPYAGNPFEPGSTATPGQREQALKKLGITRTENGFRLGGES